MYVTRTGATNIGSRFYLAGVVAAVHTRQVLGQIILTGSSNLTGHLAVLG